MLAISGFISYPLCMNTKAITFIFLSALAILNIGTIRRAEDPIRDTQTNPILYEQKKEEEKGGKKGPLLYNVKYNPWEAFFIDPPYEKDKKSSTPKGITEAGNESVETEGWWEEPAAPSGASSSVEAAAESSQESSSYWEEVPNQNVESHPASEANTKNTSSGQGDDYWW
jgi:hypothetical protein